MSLNLLCRTEGDQEPICSTRLFSLRSASGIGVFNTSQSANGYRLKMFWHSGIGNASTPPARPRTMYIPTVAHRVQFDNILEVLSPRSSLPPLTAMATLSAITLSMTNLCALSMNPTTAISLEDATTMSVNFSVLAWMRLSRELDGGAMLHTTDFTTISKARCKT
jgi:hypothetical protein